MELRFKIFEGSEGIYYGGDTVENDLHYKGEWDFYNVYVGSDIVKLDSAYYVAKEGASVNGKLPSHYPGCWDLLNNGTVIDEPIGFDSFKSKIERGSEHGISAEVSVGSLDFYGDAAELIRTAYNADIDSELGFVVEIKCSDTDVFSEIYRGMIDLSTYEDNTSDYCIVSCKVGEIGVRTTFNNRVETILNLHNGVMKNLDGVDLVSREIAKEVVIPSKGILFRDIITLDNDVTTNHNVHNMSTFIKPALNMNSITEIGKLQTNSDNVQYGVISEQPFFSALNIPNPKLSFKIKCTVKTNSTPNRVSNGRLTVSYKPDGLASVTIWQGTNMIVTSLNSNTLIWEANEIWIPNDAPVSIIVTYYQDYNDTRPVNIDFTIHKDSEISISYLSTMETSNCDLALAHETLSRATEVISGLTVKSDWYGRFNSGVNPFPENTFKNRVVGFMGEQVGYDGNNIDCPDGFFVTGTTGSNTLRFSNVITGDGYWTISFEMRGKQGIAIPVNVDICDNPIVMCMSTGNDTWKKFVVTAYVSNYGDGSTYNFIDFSGFGWVYYLFKNVKVEKGTLSTPLDVGGGALKGLVKGLRLRNGDTNRIHPTVINSSFKDLYLGLKAIDNIGWGFSEEDGQLFVRIENWKWFYKNEVILTIANPKEKIRKLNEKEVYSRLKIGYAKYAAVEDINSVDTFHTERNYSSGLKAIDHEMSQLCKFIADPYAIEFTRRKSFDKTTKDWKYDENIFVFALSLGQPDAVVGNGGSITTDLNAPLVYAVDSGVVASGDTMISPETMINFRISPFRNACKFIDVVKQGNLTKRFNMTSGVGNVAAKGEPITVAGTYYLEDPAGQYLVNENDSLFFDNQPILKPETIEFEYPLTVEEYNYVRANPYGKIVVDGEVCYLKKIEYGFLDGLAKFDLVPTVDN